MARGLSAMSRPEALSFGFAPDVIRATSDLSPAARDAFDIVIDVRSPSEFVLDHLPGAINLPVLDDDERAEVGTLYVQTSRFLARRLGAAKVARNIAGHLEAALADMPQGCRPLVYCWRGGMRSNAMATVLGQVGWHTAVVEGGYRSWRRKVVAQLHASVPLPHRFILVDGPTGVGKTALLGALADRGEQVVDLEALAGHRGSLFGETGAGQPTQKLFESRLHDALERLDQARPLYLEAESSRIGSLAVPASLWSAMRIAPRVRSEAPIGERVARVLADYAWLQEDRSRLVALIRRLPTHHSRADREAWLAMATDGDLAPLVEALMQAHYDPAYARAVRAHDRPAIGCVSMSGPIGEAAARVAALVAA